MTYSEVFNLTRDWYVNVYKYRDDDNYQDQSVLIIEDLPVSTDPSYYSLLAEFHLDDLHNRLGDYRAFTYQVFDAENTLQWQGAFVLNPYGSTL